MTDEQIKNWGPFGIIASLAGVASWFIGDIYASILGVAAAFTGLVGVRKQQKLSLAGMYLGCLATLYVCLQILGIVKLPAELQTGKSHLVKSIEASIRVHEILKNNRPLSNENIDRLIGQLENALKEAKMVNITNIDDQVPGFAMHYGDEFIPGVKLLMEGFEDAHIGKKLKGAVLLEKWARWNRDHRAELGKIKDQSPSIISFLIHWIK